MLFVHHSNYSVLLKLLTLRTSLHMYKFTATRVLLLISNLICTDAKVNFMTDRMSRKKIHEVYLLLKEQEMAAIQEISQ